MKDDCGKESVKKVKHFFDKTDLYMVSDLINQSNWDAQAKSDTIVRLILAYADAKTLISGSDSV